MRAVKSITVFVFCWLSLQLFGQQPDEHCGTDHLLQQLLKEPAEEASRRLAHEAIQKYMQAAASRDGSDDTVITIPVVVHVIHTGGAIGTGANIADTFIYSQLQVLNECFNAANTDREFVPEAFNSRIANVHLKFCLARFDTLGNPTTGITRDSFPNETQTSQFDSKVKLKTYWDPTRYLNIWITRLTTILGYTSYIRRAVPDYRDGIVVDHRYFGKNPPIPPTPNNRFRQGKTAVHEVGHWLGLYHIFNDSCSGNTPQTCATGGDYICDTPPQAYAQYGCPGFNENTCTESPKDDSDMWMNYMNYSDDACMWMFTTEQGEEMRAVLNTTKKSIQFSTAAGDCKLPNVVGVEEVAESKVNVLAYPNPTTGMVALQYHLYTGTSLQVKVADITGRPVLERMQAGKSGSCSIDLTDEPPGIYFIQACTPDASITLKVSLLR